MFEITQTRAAELFLDGDAVQTDGSHLWPEVARELVRAVDLRCARRDLVLGEIACGRADHVGGFAEIEIEAGGDVGDHRGGLNIENVFARNVATKQSRRKLRRTSVFASGLLRSLAMTMRLKRALEHAAIDQKILAGDVACVGAGDERA